MKIKVAEPPVRKNVELFLEILKRAQEENEDERLFLKAWINCNTGQLMADYVRAESLKLAKKEWKPVEICCVYDPQQGEVCFWIEEQEGGKEAFDCGGLAPNAFTVIRETFEVLNDVSSRLKGPSDLKTKISVLTRTEVSTEMEAHVDKNILLEAFHTVDRLQAEILLWNEPPGTYFFRKDLYAALLEEELERALGKKLKCFTLTYSEPDRKFTDLTVVHIDNTWLIYNDDPMLEGKRFPSLEELLGDWDALLKFPFYPIR